MTEHEIRQIAESVLREQLGKFGFDRAEIEFGQDQDGEPAVFINAIFSTYGLVESGPFLNAIGRIRSQLSERGDERFPYVMLVTPDDDEAAA